jgi:hypothetical protein
MILMLLGAQVLELCDKAEVALSNEERGALERDCQSNVVDDSSTAHYNVFTARKGQNTK